MKSISRRAFTKKSALALGAIPFATLPSNFIELNETVEKLNINIFSKHLQFLDFKELGARTVEMGFNGVDLTVRPKGHVLPENVFNILPKAIEDIKLSGAKCIMMTTAVNNVNNPIDINVLKAASECGIKYYRTNWFKYSKNKSMIDSLNDYQTIIKDISIFNKKHGLIGCYQNHAGTSVGASIWEIKKIIELANLDTFGAQYDIRHAVVEGGLSWSNGLKLIKDNINSIVLKDFKWGQVNGIWKPINVPIGEGMVDFISYFKLLKKYKINVPVSLHCEYDLGGAERGSTSPTISKKDIYKAISKDLKTLQQFWEEA
ncbi:TIM barrel protein [uncultured Algibacter sp.]|uniref:sugar phosphate isomerase/epimerase family protein n=1 Tax=uncultured Algibacter sp. TaxID=298659 RepID=UPI002604A460|nr:TIM barrel protein [uncultured Algibacter sp.]